MSKALRLSEKWFRRGLWLVAFVFAGFLVGLGGTIVSDLPKVEKPLRTEDFLDRAAADRLRAGKTIIPPPIFPEQGDVLAVERKVDVSRASIRSG